MRLDRNGSPNGAVALFPNSRLLACVLGSLALLSGCGGDKHQTPPELVLGDELSTETVAFADGAGLRLPRHLDGFERTSLVSEPKSGGATATYEAGSTTITIRVRRVGEGRTLFTSPSSIATGAHSSATLAHEVASLRAADPALAAGPATDFYLVRFGAIQAGRTQTLGGPDAPTTVDAFCCVNGIWSYVFVIGGSETGDGTRFVRDLAWSASESASVEEPQ